MKYFVLMFVISVKGGIINVIELWNLELLICALLSQHVQFTFIFFPVFIDSYPCSVVTLICL